MLEGSISKDEDNQNLYNEAINTQLVKLIKNKTLPLNRLRYLHLQKINSTNVKQRVRTKPSTPQVLSPEFQYHVKQSLPTLNKSKSSRVYNSTPTNTLSNRLKSIKNLKSSSRLMSIDQKTSRCFQNLRSIILASERSHRMTALNKQQRKKIRESQNLSREREYLLQLSSRAERYLRTKKHQLKEKYCKPENQAIRRKETISSQIGLILTSLKNVDLGVKKNDDDSMEIQLMQEIRSTMLQQKINRIKRSINHKKILQLR